MGKLQKDGSPKKARSKNSLALTSVTLKVKSQTLLKEKKVAANMAAHLIYSVTAILAYRELLPTASADLTVDRV